MWYKTLPITLATLAAGAVWMAQGARADAPVRLLDSGGAEQRASVRLADFDLDDIEDFFDEIDDRRFRRRWSVEVFPYFRGYGYYGGFPRIEVFPRPQYYPQPGAYGTGYWPQVTPNPPVPSGAAPAVVTNPATNSATLNFQVDGAAYSLAPGETRDFDVSVPHVVQFDRGGGAGMARYSLTSGTYTFTPTAQGWELYHRAHEPTLAEPQASPESRPAEQPASQTVVEPAQEKPLAPVPLPELNGPAFEF
jgi:hypothetical protein